MKKENAYKWATGQIRAKVKNHINTISTLANTAAILKERFTNFFWVGFYFIEEDCLLLGPFQGPPACVKLDKNKGVCAACANSGKPVIVPDVNKFPNHVACDSRSVSEIVVPVFDQQGKLQAVLDIDSEKPGDFDNMDLTGLTGVAELLRSVWK